MSGSTEIASSFGLGVGEDGVRGEGGNISKRGNYGAGSCWWTVIIE